MYRTFADAIGVPLLANMTEFGKTPYYTKEQFGEHGVAMVLYPLSAFRTMSRAALNVYETILHTGTQKSSVKAMQQRSSITTKGEQHHGIKRNSKAEDFGIPATPSGPNPSPHQCLKNGQQKVAAVFFAILK